MKANCSPFIFNATFYKGRGGPAQALSIFLFTLLVIVNAFSSSFKFIFNSYTKFVHACVFFRSETKKIHMPLLIGPFFIRL